MRLIYFFICAIFLSTSLSAEEKRVTLLHFNDVYEIAPINGKGGLAELATLIQQEKKKSPEAITIVSGDFLFPSVLSTMTEGKQMIELFNALGVDFVVFGNHEFDYGPKILLRRMQESKFDWLGTNISLRGNGRYGNSIPFVMKTLDTIPVGFFGVISPGSAATSNPGDNLLFGDPIAVSKTAVKKLKNRGAKVIVAITHMDFPEDKLLANEVEGINIILGGHDHDPITWEESGILIQKSGTDAHYLGVIHLRINLDDRGNVKQIIPEWSMISTAGVTPDPAVKQIVDRYLKLMDAQLKVPIGTLDEELDSRRFKVRSQESSMANLITDLLRSHYKADVAFFNGGGIRGNKVYPKGSTLTKEDILTELPFSDYAILLELNGKELKDVLEHGASAYEANAGRFLHVSGLTAELDPKAQVGDRIKNIEINGQPLNPDQVYRVATGSYIADGGDAFTMLKQMKRITEKENAPIISELVIDYIENEKTITPSNEVRIKIIRR